MKFRLHPTLIGEPPTIISHVFLDSLHGDILKEYSGHYMEKFAGVENPEIEIKLTIEGFDVSPEKFFEHVLTHCENEAKKEAQRLLVEKMGIIPACEQEAAEALAYDLHEVASAVEDLGKLYQGVSERMRHIVARKFEEAKK